MVVVVLITSHLLGLRTFAAGCMIHFLIQHDQGYRLHIFYTLDKRTETYENRCNEESHTILLSINIFH